MGYICARMAAPLPLAAPGPGAEADTQRAFPANASGSFGRSHIKKVAELTRASRLN
jgi:hypothetical protein